MKKLTMILMAALVLLLASAGMAEPTLAEPVRLDGTTIINEELVYYSGSVDGGERGVFVMNADGSDPKLISDATADLLALSGSNLLIYQYDMDSGDASMAVLMQDGTICPVGSEYPGAAIAADGRFYWGAASCRDDGSDLQVYFDAERYWDYYPLAVDGGYYYYLDCTEMGDSVYSEGTVQPMGAALCRMKLSDRTTETVSGLGTRFLGIENGLIYYSRDNFWHAADAGSEEVQVDEGLFCSDADTLTETRLAAYAEGDSVVDSYTLVKDGVVYGLHADYSSEDASSCIIRIRNDGTRLPDIPTDSNAWIALSSVEGDTLYISLCSIIASTDDFIQEDRIIAVNLTDGSETVLNPDSMDMLFYTEMDPCVEVVNGRIYFAPYDMERWSVCLKSMNTDGSDLQLLAYGVSFAEG